jgi:hypothetical protein
MKMKNIVCFHDDIIDQYVCSQPTPRFIQSNIPPPTFSDHRRQQLEKYDDITTTQLTFALFSTYILFPLLYIILSTGNIAPIMILWRYIQSGVFNTVHSIKEYSLDVVYAILRLFGQYSFSTYTVVKDGREVYASSSMFFFYKSDVSSVYRIDRAKYDVCKWIDRQCKQYRIENHGEEPELTDTHNDIYDFIMHKVDKQPFVRIHRGDFSGRTHTLIQSHYRPFKKWYQLADKADITICIPSSGGDDAAPAPAPAPTPAPETFTIYLKTPYDFFLEKNEILDKKFLQWKLIRDYGRTDLANYIRTPFSTYTVRLYYSDCMNEYFEFTHPKALAALNATTATAANATDADANPRTPVYSLNDSHSIVIGSLYAIKVDSVLRCPVFESGESQVYDIDSMLTNYYDDSDSDSEAENGDSDNESDTISISDDDGDDAEDGEGYAQEGDARPDVNAVHDDPEFEMIEEPSTK